MGRVWDKPDIRKGSANGWFNRELPFASVPQRMVKRERLNLPEPEPSHRANTLHRWPSDRWAACILGDPYRTDVAPGADATKYERKVDASKNSWCELEWPITRIG